MRIECKDNDVCAGIASTYMIEINAINDVPLRNAYDGVPV
jgi:hypothetical protein